MFNMDIYSTAKGSLTIIAYAFNNDKPNVVINKINNWLTNQPAHVGIYASTFTADKMKNMKSCCTYDSAFIGAGLRSLHDTIRDMQVQFMRKCKNAPSFLSKEDTEFYGVLYDNNWSVMLNFTDTCFSTHMLYSEIIYIEHYEHSNSLVISSAETEFLPFTKDNLVKTSMYSPENICDFTEGEPFVKDFVLRACPDCKDVIDLIYSNADALKNFKWYINVWFKQKGQIDSINLEHTKNGLLRQYLTDQEIQENLNMLKS